MTIWRKITGQTPPPKDWPPELADAMDGSRYGPEFLVWDYGGSDISIAHYDRLIDHYLTTAGLPIDLLYTHWAEIPIPTEESVEQWLTKKSWPDYLPQGRTARDLGSYA